MAFNALWQRVLKKLRTLKYFQNALNLRPNQLTMQKKKKNQTALRTYIKTLNALRKNMYKSQILDLNI